jgi:hypothetical protein
LGMLQGKIAANQFSGCRKLLVSSIL